ncbi:MAG TPA: septum formation initiator family protein, partial [Rugosimonospora sp.]|nr:septum formation initiator family protein [Rugosimonospora sp.]
DLGAKRTRPPQPHRFTGRATVLACVLGALLLAYAYPVRIYLNQQAQIASLQASQAAQSQRIKNLSDQSAKWNDPEYVKAQARSRLQMVKPGDVAYLIIDAGAPATPSSDPDAGRAKNTGPWYAQLWSSVQAADKPRTRS